MIDWSDDAILLTARPFDDAHAIARLLTRTHGVHAGLVHGARRAGAALQPGTRHRVTWRARLAEQLGTWALEPLAATDPTLFDSALRLAGVQAVVAIVDAALPEREPHPAIHDALAATLDVLASLEPEGWASVLVRFELGLLGELGFGLDLSRCALTGVRAGLIGVSPNSGRAVSQAAADGQGWAARLLPLPAFLAGGPAPDLRDAIAGLDLTGHFLARHLFAPAHRDLPEPRRRLRDLLARTAASPVPSTFESQNEE